VAREDGRLREGHPRREGDAYKGVPQVVRADPLTPFAV
jgi:hypothetical protein